MATVMLVFVTRSILLADTLEGGVMLFGNALIGHCIFFPNFFLAGGK
jgi:hypothetical protein